MTISSGDAHPFPIYNARYRCVFPLFDADGDLVTGATTPDTELSQDQGTFADATNEMTEIATSSGMYYIDLTAGEMDTQCTAIIAKSATAGMKTTPITLYPVRLPQIRTGTAQAGGASTITLDSGASALDDFYNGCYVNITNNSPANAQGQARRITNYVGSTKVATVQSAWGTNPSSASTFEILANPDTVQVAGWTGNELATPSVAGVPEVDVTHWIGTAAATPTTAGVPEVDVTFVAGTAAQAASGRFQVDVELWNGSAVATPTVAGVPEVDLTHVAGATTDVSALATNVAAILVDTGTTLQGEVDGIQADTEDIQSRLPAALVSGRMNSNVAAIDDNATAATNLSRHARGVVLAAVSGAGSTTTVVDTGLTETTDNHYNGRVIVFTSGALAGQVADITDYNGTTKQLTVSTLTEAPADTDQFVIV